MSGGVIARERRLFEHHVRERARRLPPEARGALLGMLRDLVVLAQENAAESHGRSKWMMFAYWKVVAVYGRHFARIIRSAA